jgi:hypothetical protein
MSLLLDKTRHSLSFSKIECGTVWKNGRSGGQLCENSLESGRNEGSVLVRSEDEDWNFGIV